MGLIEWEDPIYKRGIYEDLFDAVRDRPGEWAVFKRGVRNPGGFFEKLKEGLYRGCGPDEFEYRSSGDRTTGDVTIWIRVPLKEADEGER